MSQKQSLESSKFSKVQVGVSSIRILPEELRMQRAELLLITPGVAGSMLEHNSCNRRIRNGMVDKLKRAIERGEWRCNGETIVVSDRGTIITGQHRLKAVVAAGIPIYSWVIRNVPQEYFTTADQGRAKTSGDILGIDGEVSAIVLASASKWAYVMEKDGGYISSSPTPMQIKDIIERHPSLRYWSVMLGKKKNAKKYFISPMIAPLALAEEKYGRDAVLAFFERVVDGLGLSARDPEYHLKTRLDAATKYSREAPVVRVVWTIKALHSAMTGKPMGVLRYRASEAWPSL